MKVSIYVLLATSPIAQSPYRMAPTELVELKIQLKMLLHKYFTLESSSVIYGKKKGWNPYTLY